LGRTKLRGNLHSNFDKFPWSSGFIVLKP
jgi:hypothetical protein